jgi:hypothetical protein
MKNVGTSITAHYFSHTKADATIEEIAIITKVFLRNFPRCLGSTFSV